VEAGNRRITFTELLPGLERFPDAINLVIAYIQGSSTKVKSSILRVFYDEEYYDEEYSVGDYYKGDIYFFLLYEHTNKLKQETPRGLCRSPGSQKSIGMFFSSFQNKILYK